MPHNHPPGYDSLPEVVRHQISPKEYAWMPDAAKQRIVEDMTEPDDDMEDQAR